MSEIESWMVGRTDRQRIDDQDGSIATLSARVKELEAALEKIAKQPLSVEMDAEQSDAADFVADYNSCVHFARKALQEQLKK